MNTRPLQVDIRMYKVNELGDCFLLRFKEDSNDGNFIISNVLVDCGSFRNSDASVKRMQEIMAHIKDELKGESLQVVIGTHQHNDHLSGFVHGEEIFRSIGIEQVWLSWLDNPKDKLALVVQKEQQKALDRLDLVGRTIFKKFEEGMAREKVVDVLGFSSDLQRKNASEPLVPAKGISILKTAGKSNAKYLEPGEIVPLPKLEKSVKVYVLGPPMDRDKLRDITASSDETYDHRLAAASTQAQTIISAFSNYVTEVEGEKLENWEETHFPFNDHYKISKDSFGTRITEYNDKTKNMSCVNVWNTYNDPGEQWRNIDNDWLDEAGNLALYMNKYTNNTSLVLAFELVNSGKFLLFVGDAQTGNWSSWKDVKWKKAGKDFTLDKILSNTILYKVGHHCSHNATLVEGLEAMTHEDLVAMIPVDANDPNITKEKGWKMPAKNLYEKLKQKTRNRVMRMDQDFAEGCEPQDENGKLFWNSVSHEHALKKSDLFVEYSFKV